MRVEQRDGRIDIYEVEWPGVSNDHVGRESGKETKGKYNVLISGLDRDMLAWWYNSL